MGWVKDIYDILKDSLSFAKKRRDSHKPKIYEPTKDEIDEYAVKPFKNKIDAELDSLQVRGNVKLISAKLMILMTLFFLGAWWVGNEILWKKAGPGQPVSNSSDLKHSPIIKELINISDGEELLDRLTHYSQKMYIGVGHRENFSSLEGAYVFIVDNKQVLGVFKFMMGSYYSLKSDEVLSELSGRFSGMATIWVSDHSEPQKDDR